MCGRVRESVWGRGLRDARPGRVAATVVPRGRAVHGACRGKDETKHSGPRRELTQTEDSVGSRRRRDAWLSGAKEDGRTGPRAYARRAREPSRVSNHEHARDNQSARLRATPLSGVGSEGPRLSPRDQQTSEQGPFPCHLRHCRRFGAQTIPHDAYSHTHLDGQIDVGSREKHSNARNALTMRIPQPRAR